MPWLDHLGEFILFCPQSTKQKLMRCSVLCSELAVKLIDEPFISAMDDRDEWAL